MVRPFSASSIFRPELREARWPHCSCPSYRLGLSAVACFECISVGVGGAILIAIVFLGVAGGETGPPLTRPRRRLVPRSVRLIGRGWCGPSGLPAGWRGCGDLGGGGCGGTGTTSPSSDSVQLGVEVDHLGAELCVHGRECWQPRFNTATPNFLLDLNHIRSPKRLCDNEATEQPPYPNMDEYYPARDEDGPPAFAGIFTVPFWVNKTWDDAYGWWIHRWVFFFSLYSVIFNVLYTDKVDDSTTRFHLPVRFPGVSRTILVTVNRWVLVYLGSALFITCATAFAALSSVVIWPIFINRIDNSVCHAPIVPCGGSPCSIPANSDISGIGVSFDPTQK